MIRSILVCVDAPTTPDVPVRYAIDLARWCDAALQLAVVAEERIEEAGGDLLDDDYLPDERHQPDDERAAVEDDPLVARAGEMCAEAGVGWSAVTLEGQRSDRVARRAKAVDLVVLSRSDALRGGWLRGVPPALSTLQQSGRAVLVSAPTHQKLDAVVALYEDGAPPARALSTAADLAALGKLPLTVITASTGAGEAVVLSAEARRYLEGRRVDAEYWAREGEPRREVRSALADRRGSLLVAGVKFPAPWARLTRQPLAADLLADADVPVLLVA